MINGSSDMNQVIRFIDNHGFYFKLVEYFMGNK